MKKRIAWLLNHNALIERELPIFSELGYEIYVPKIAYFDVSAGITYAYDEGLSIPTDKLEVLNHTDFYDYNINDEVYKILNDYFDIVMFIHNPNLVKNLVDHYNGILAYRAFGRLTAEGSHTDYIIWSLGEGYLRRIEKLGKRFFFLQISENLSEIECEFFQSRAMYAPVGIGKGVYIQDSWTGENRRILFVCPRIGMSPYFENIYKNFVKDFGDMPYSIAGSQPITIGYDKNVLGYLSKEKYELLYDTHKVMYYHSMEPRHIHYHPLEAIVCGLPLIFMGGGQLDLLGGNNLPGRCSNIKEARKKIKHILNGDKKLINDIRTTQPILLEKYLYEYCKTQWLKVFNEMKQLELKSNCYTHKKRIGILLPAEYTGGVLDYTIRLIKALYRGIQLSGEAIEIIFGYPEHDNFKNKNYFKEISDRGIEIRPFFWEEISNARANEISKILGYHHLFFEKVYYAANDGIRYFEDCDFLLFTADRVRLPLFSLVPYGCIIHDYIQRYIPQIMMDFYEGSFLQLVRNAVINFTTTESTLSDAIQYCGISKNKIHLIPLFFEKINLNNTGQIQEKAYFLWSTNVVEHKNHKIALEALSIYYEKGGRLKCYITGTNTKFFTSNYKGERSSYVKEISKIIEQNIHLKRNIKILGNLPKDEYIKTLQNSAFLLHPGYGDNGNGSAFDAAMLRVPTISCDYPAMRNMSEKTHIKFAFFEKNNCLSLANILNDMEKNYKLFSNNIPPYEKLLNHTVSDDNLCKRIYSIIKQYAQI